MAEDYEEVSCADFFNRIKDKKRIAVHFVGKEFPATESYIEAIAKAEEEGFFGEMEHAVITVEDETCDKLAERESVELLPTTCVYEYGKKIGCVSPTDEDGKIGYHRTIEKLIDLSGD